MQTPMIAALAGPSKGGKTYSALRLATGMAQGGKIVMINTEGPRGHQYADSFKYDACDLTEPFSMKRYEEAIKFVAESNPAVVIIDSMSHAHEGRGGLLDHHERELDRMLGNDKNDYKKRDRMTWAAWVRPKYDESNMINTMLQQKFHIVLCFRGKEKLKIIKGKDPVNMGWRPIASDRIHFETAVTLILPPNSKGTPDLSQTGSELRSPFDKMITGKQIDEELGSKLAEWAKGTAKQEATHEEPKTIKYISEEQRKQFFEKGKAAGKSIEDIKQFVKNMIGTDSTKDIPVSKYEYLCNEVVK